MKKLSVLLLALFLCLPAATRAEGDSLPDNVRAQVRTPLAEVGHGNYRRFGFRVYEASLWAPGGKWDPTKPYVLQLRYTRGVSKDTMVETVTDNIREQNVTDEATLTKWNGTLNEVLPAVEDGDTIVGIALPKKASMLFFNGKKIASIEDQTFSKAFFDIWLGKTADEDLRAQLLGSEANQ